MKDKLSPMMVNPPVFPSGSVKSGMAGNGEERITSLEIATIANKRHADVMKAIRKMEESWFKVARGNFSLCSYLDEKDVSVLVIPLPNVRVFTLPPSLMMRQERSWFCVGRSWKLSIVSRCKPSK